MEKHYRVKEVAEMLSISREKARQLFACGGPGVLNLSADPRGRRSLRISGTALEAVRRKLLA